MEWYDEHGETMSLERWTDPAHRTLQYVAASTPEFEGFNRVLLMVHGTERPTTVTLPDVEGVTSYVSLWSSADERPSELTPTFSPGDTIALPGTAMRLFRAE
jgi:glycogen operon protein